MAGQERDRRGGGREKRRPGGLHRKNKTEKNPGSLLLVPALQKRSNWERKNKAASHIYLKEKCLEVKRTSDGPSSPQNARGCKSRGRGEKGGQGRQPHFLEPSQNILTSVQSRTGVKKGKRILMRGFQKTLPPMHDLKRQK